MNNYIEVQKGDIDTYLQAIVDNPPGTNIIGPRPDGNVSKFVMRLRYHAFKKGFSIKTSKQRNTFVLCGNKMPPRLMSDGTVL